MSKENQLIYTTHSPFLVDSNNLSGIHALYVDEIGNSSISSDLRSNKKIANKSIYPIHAAIGLTVSETLLLGSQPVLVEGVSDQIYFQIIKNFILSEGKYKNNKELVFIPTGGIRGMSPIIAILSGRENSLPFVILDSDKSGKDKYAQLKKDIYENDTEKLILISDYLNDGNWEIEDLMPTKDIAKIFAKKYRALEDKDDFDDVFDIKKPIINQMENFSKDNALTLGNGWKVELAKEFQRGFSRILDKGIDSNISERWLSLFSKITNQT